MDKRFDINIHGLENKSYDFEFEGDSSFFEAFDQEIIDKGHFKANVILNKTDNHIGLKLNILAHIDLVCDRSLDDFVEVFNIEEKYIYKFGHKAEVVSEEIEIIPFGTVKINIAELIYDFIALKIPIKKLHPRFKNNTGSIEDDGIMVYQDQKAIEEEKNEKQHDPRWAALLKLKDN